MGKPIKFTDRNTPWAKPRGRITRPERSLPIRKRYLIVCEGTKTEPNYFMSLEKDLKPHVVELKIIGEGDNTVNLVTLAEEFVDNERAAGRNIDEVWIVFDIDSFPDQDINSAVEMAEARRFHPAYSNEAFELWYLLHYEYCDSALSRTTYSRRLKKYIGKRYQKNDEEMYEILKESGNQTQAIQSAKRLHEYHSNNGNTPADSNPSTLVYELIEELNKYLDSRSDD